MGLGAPRQARGCTEWQNKPGLTWCSTRTELREVLGPPSLGNAVHLYVTRSWPARVHSELGHAWSRGLTTALQTQLPTPMFLEYCGASMSLSQHRLLQWSPVGHRRWSPIAFGLQRGLSSHQCSSPHPAQTPSSCTRSYPLLKAPQVFLEQEGSIKSLSKLYRGLCYFKILSFPPFSI